MSCSITQGLALGCRNAIGGIQTVFIGNYDNTLVYNGELADDTDYPAAGITSFNSTTPGTTFSFWAFPQPLATGDMTSPATTSESNGTTFYTQTVNMNIRKFDINSAPIISKLTVGIFRLIVLDNLGQYWYIGAVTGARVKTSTPGVGKTQGDLNGAMIGFEALEPLPPLIIPSLLTAGIAYGISGELVLTTV